MAQQSYQQTQKVDITPRTDSDAVARAAIERADKLEKQVAELTKRLDAAPVATPVGPLPAEYAGEKTYRLKLDRYDSGIYYAAGSLITVTNKRPSKHWTLVEKRAATETVDVVPVRPSARAADQQV